MNIHTLLFAAAIAQASMLFSTAHASKEIVTKDLAGHEYRYTPINMVTTDLFDRVSSALAMRESDLVCGKEPSRKNIDAWYSYGDCSGDYGPIDTAK